MFVPHPIMMWIFFFEFIVQRASLDMLKDYLFLLCFNFDTVLFFEFVVLRGAVVYLISLISQGIQKSAKFQI